MQIRLLYTSDMSVRVFNLRPAAFWRATKKPPCENTRNWQLIDVSALLLRFFTVVVVVVAAHTLVSCHSHTYIYTLYTSFFFCMIEVLAEHFALPSHSDRSMRVFFFVHLIIYHICTIAVFSFMCLLFWFFMCFGLSFMLSWFFPLIYWHSLQELQLSRSTLTLKMISEMKSKSNMLSARDKGSFFFINGLLILDLNKVEALLRGVDF